MTSSFSGPNGCVSCVYSNKKEIVLYNSNPFVLRKDDDGFAFTNETYHNEGKYAVELCGYISELQQ